MSALGTLAEPVDPNDGDLMGLLDQLYQRSGCDLRGYARSPLRLRLHAWLADHEPDAGIAEISDRVVGDVALGQLLEAITEHDTPIFGDPDADRALRDRVVPFLRTFPSVNVWLPACAGGGQAYATAIILHEEGLGNRVHVYATDLSEAALERARRGRFSRSELRAAEPGYQHGGGRSALADHFVVGGDQDAMIRPGLRALVTFVQHDLATGASFNEFQLIRCRDILPALGPTLQDRVFGLFHDSLVRFGVLALGPQHADRLRPPAPRFEVLDAGARHYRRAR